MTMRLSTLLVLLPLLLLACAQARPRPAAEGERAAVTFHVLGLQKTPSGAT